MTDKQTERRTRGPGKKPAKVHVTMRVPRYVFDYFQGDKVEMRDALREHVDNKLAGGVDRLGT